MAQATATAKPLAACLFGSTHWPLRGRGPRTRDGFGFIEYSLSAYRRLEAIRVLADPWNDQAATVDAFDDGGDVEREDGHPREHEKDPEDAAEAKRCQAHDTGHHDVCEQCDELGDHQHEAVLGMPLQLGVVFLDNQRDEREQPQISE